MARLPTASLYISHRDYISIVVMAEELLRCNICGITVGTSQASEHVSTPAHMSLKSKLEEDLRAVKKTEDKYKNDSSVILQWSSSI